MTAIEEIRLNLKPEFELFNAGLQDCYTSDNVLLSAIFEHISKVQGKQLRPMLTMLAAHLCHGVTEKTISSAIALEMIHNASLIHDDVIDHSDMRRGISSVNDQWNNKIAVLAGDYLLTKAMRLITSLRNNSITNVILNMTQILAEGELDEMHWGGADRWAINEQSYLKIIYSKTAMLFSACAEIGAISSGATQKQRAALRRFGEMLGICFQLKDDELDYSDNYDIGKPRMSDIRDGKVTLPLIVALERASKSEAEHIKQLCEQTIGEQEEQEIKSFVMRYDGLGYVHKRMEEFKAEASAALDVFHPSPTKKSLLELLNYSINRVY